jgi:hypothetical protein
MIFAWIFFTVMLVGLSVAVVSFSFDEDDSVVLSLNNEETLEV